MATANRACACCIVEVDTQATSQVRAYDDNDNSSQNTESKKDWEGKALKPEARLLSIH